MSSDEFAVCIFCERNHSGILLRRTIVERKTVSSMQIATLAAVLVGMQSAAVAQTYTRFDPLPCGTYPIQMDASGRVVGTAHQSGGPATVFVRNTDGTIILTSAPLGSDWAGFWGTSGIFGRYADANSTEHGYLGPIAGPFTQFDVAGSTGTYPTHANAAGQVVGFWTDATNKVHGFVRSASGTITKFDVPGEAQTQPESINSSGQVAGVAYSSTGVAEGFVGTPGGTLTTYKFPSGSVYGSANLNDVGQIAGYYADRNFNSKGYFRNSNGTFTTLTEGGQVGVGDINLGGYIVGVFGGKYSGRKDGYLNRPDGTFATIEYPGANTIDSSTKALDINASGLIVGQYQQTTLSNGDTIWHGFIVTGVH
jgi:hypothetical protein